MSFWSKLFGSDVDDSGNDTPAWDQVNSERPATNPREAALDSIRQHGWSSDDMTTVLGGLSPGSVAANDYCDRMHNAYDKWLEDNPN